MQCILNAEARDSLVQLAYRAWSGTWDTLKAVKAEKDDGSEDWAAFHQERLNNATQSEAKAQRVLDAIKPYSPLICGS